jgi:hypothetical protein
VYRDIPLPSWQVVYPDKLLQFRPLDLLRLDLFGLAGATAALAQAKYNSIVLQVCMPECGASLDSVHCLLSGNLSPCCCC